MTLAFFGLGRIYGFAVAGLALVSGQYWKLDRESIGRRRRQSESGRWPSKPGDP